MTEMEQKVLYWLLRLPFLSVADLMALLNQKRTTLERTMRGLVQQQMIVALDVGAMVAPHAGRYYVYHLTNDGLYQIAVHIGGAPGPLARSWDSDEAGLVRLLPRLPDLLRLQIFIQRLLNGARARAVPHGGRWEWTRDYHHPFLVAREQRVVAQADAAVTVCVGPVAAPVHAMGAFIFLDHLVVDWNRVKQLLTRMTQFREAAERWPVYAAFPPVLVLGTSLHHAERWQRANAEVATALGVPPLVGGIFLADHAANPWDQSWLHLVTGRSVRLNSLLRDLPVAALPPQVPEHGTWAAGVAAESPIVLSRVIRGDFARRAARIMLPQTTTQIALAALKLTAAQQRLLDQIALVPRIPVGDLARWLRRPALSVARSVRELQARGLVVMGPTALEQQVTITPLGVRLLAARYQLRPQATVLRAALRRSPRTVTHDIGIYHFCLDLCEAAWRQPGWEVVWWEPAMMCVLRFKDVHGRWHMLRPDAGGLIRCGLRQRHWWLEWDGGTMDNGDLTVKFQAYDVYLRSAHWRTARLSGMPLLLCVVPTRAQLDRFRRVATTVLPDPKLFPYEAVITLADVLASAGPLATIWGPLRRDEPWRLRPCFAEATQAS